MGWSAFLIPLFLLIVDAQGLTASRVPSGVLIGAAKGHRGGVSRHPGGVFRQASGGACGPDGLPRGEPGPAPG
ncbi:unnamed protein product, partial [Heterosigma akashiwo]